MRRCQRRDHVGIHHDLADALDYYRREAPEQIGRLADLYLKRVRLIELRPFAHPLLFEDYRHVVLKPFNFMVVYTVEETTIDVLALLHARRDPEWIEHKVRGRTFS